MSLCECGHKIAWNRHEELSQIKRDVNTLNASDFRHVGIAPLVSENRKIIKEKNGKYVVYDDKDNIINTDYQGKIYLDMTQRPMMLECPFCQCKKVKIRSIGEDLN